MKSTVRHIGRALLRPARRDTLVRPLRSLLALPVVFDLLSMLMQLADLTRTRRIKDECAVAGDHHRAVQNYNADVTLKKVVTTTRRMDICYRMLALARPDLSTERLLIVGPRNRHELLSAWLHGYAWRNIEAIDLYSTHPKIQVMNMEAMRWPDMSFDAVSMANTLSYAGDTGRAISEVGRVLKSGGRFAFSATYDPDGSRWPGDEVSGNMIAEMLHRCGFEIAVHLAEDKTNSQGRRQTSHYLLARKIPPAEARRDPFKL